MSFIFKCRYRPSEGSWDCGEELTNLGETGIFESDLHLWREAALMLDNDRDSYQRTKDGDAKAYKGEFMRHYRQAQRNELERWREDESFLRVHGRIGGRR